MAVAQFTDDEKAQIRFYLGFQDQFRDVNTTLESQMRPDAISDPARTIVRGVILSLQDIDSKLVNGHKRLKASVVGSITLNAKEISMLRSEGRRFVMRLVSVFGVTPKKDVFSDGTMGGAIPLG